MAAEQTFEDKLAIQLMECAILVKKGERTNPLVLETLAKLRHFCHPEAGERRHSNGSSTNSNTGSTKSPPSSAVGGGGGPVMKPSLGVFGKIIGITGDEKKTPEQKTATSQKNAARVKADLAADIHNGENPHNHSGGSWFGLGGGSSHGTEEAAPKQHSAAAAAAPAPAQKSRPEFQRPSNPKSALIANGWIEQQRRSKMRTVWKDVLASLVEGRKPGEETTLWIQRQITNSNGVAELEALHQIPVKWLQDVTFLDFSTDNRFSLRVYNLNEDFVFRCPRDPAAAENWVMTLRSAKEAALNKKKMDNGRVPVREAHHDEKKSADAPRAPPETPHTIASAPASATIPAATAPPSAPPAPAPPAPAPPAPAPAPQPATAKKKISIKELRALAHGVGINTIGMERGDLEKIVANITQTQHAPPPPQPPRPAPAKPPEPQPDPKEEHRRQEALEAERRRRMADREAEDETRKETAAQEAERKRQEEEHQRVMAERVRAQQEALRKQKEEEERQRLARERQVREEEETRRRMAQQQAEQERRQQEEAVRRQQEEYRRRQEAWQKQQAAEEERRRQAEQQEAEQRRQQEEAYRRHMNAQQWQQQQGHAAPPQWQHHHQQQQQQPPFGFPGYQQQQQPPPPPPHGFYGQQQQPPQSPDHKYAQMAAQQDDNTSTQHIKHAILVHWALQPPMRQGLRRIEELITSIHTVFPPAFGVPGHEYFQKWKVLVAADVDDDDKLEKKVKKLRFFLHPDKLPKDLRDDQSFMCRMLWDIISDALEQHKQKKEDLNWIHN